MNLKLNIKCSLNASNFLGDRALGGKGTWLGKYYILSYHSTWTRQFYSYFCSNMCNMTAFTWRKELQEGLISWFFLIVTYATKTFLESIQRKRPNKIYNRSQHINERETRKATRNKQRKALERKKKKKAFITWYFFGYPEDNKMPFMMSKQLECRLHGFGTYWKLLATVDGQDLME